MNASFTWGAEECRLPALERKWTAGGEISSSELLLLRDNQEHNPDVRVRETCRILLAAMERNVEAEPHAQRLLRMRNLALFRNKIHPTMR